MVKIKNKWKLKVYLKDYDSGIISQELAAKHLGITPRWFRHNYKIYKSTYIPAIGVNLGRPKKEVPEEWKEIIKQEYEMFRQNALYQEKTIFAVHFGYNVRGRVGASVRSVTPKSGIDMCRKTAAAPGCGAEGAGGGSENI